jgi:hypothetical protein
MVNEEPSGWYLRSRRCLKEHHAVEDGACRPVHDDAFCWRRSRRTS